MHTLAQSPAAAYRRVDLEARIEASASEDLTLICLEEVVDALGQAVLALEANPRAVPRETLARANTIAIWLARSVAPDNPLRAPLTEFYGSLAAGIARNLAAPNLAALAQIRADFADLLNAAKAV